MHGHIFICTYGKSSSNSQIVEDQIQTPSKITCGRSYMSSRDLNAHIQHRHTAVEDNQFTNNNPSRANLITIMTVQNQKNNDISNKQQQQFQSHINHQNLIQMNPQLPPALLPSPPIPPHHQFNSNAPLLSLSQQQSLMPTLLELPHQVKRPFDFNFKGQISNNNIQQPNSFNMPPNSMQNY